jgi:hypothetical protein
MNIFYLTNYLHFNRENKMLVVIITHMKGKVFANTTKAHKGSRGITPLIFKLGTTVLFEKKKKLKNM